MGKNRSARHYTDNYYQAVCWLAHTAPLLHAVQVLHGMHHVHVVHHLRPLHPMHQIHHDGRGREKFPTLSLRHVRPPFFAHPQLAGRPKRRNH